MAIPDALVHGRRRCRCARFDDSHDLEVEALGDLRLHVALVITAIDPCRSGRRLGVHVAFVHDLERERQRLVLRELDVGVGNVKILGGKGVHKQVVELVGVEDAQRVERVVADAAVLVEHQHALVVVGRPGAGDDVVLLLEKLLVIEHFLERTRRTHHGREHAGGADVVGHDRGQGTGIELLDAGGGVGLVDLGRYAIAVDDGVHVAIHIPAVCLEEGTQRFEVVRLHVRQDIGHDGGFRNDARGDVVFGVSMHVIARLHHDGGHVEARLRDGERSR